MKKILVLFFYFVFLVLFTTNIWAETSSSSYVGASATPIRNVSLSYDTDKKSLHVEADHPSSRLQVNYVREVIVTKNTKDIQKFFFSHQLAAAKFVTDLDYAAEPGDHLDVTLYGSLGGKAQGSLDIQVAEKKGT